MSFSPQPPDFQCKVNVRRGVVSQASHQSRRKQKGLLETKALQSEGKPLMTAIITVAGIKHNTSISSGFGDYYRLAPRTWPCLVSESLDTAMEELVVAAEGCKKWHTCD